MPCASNSVAQPVGLAGTRGLGDAEEQLGDARSRGPPPCTAPSAASACTSVSGVPPDLEMTMKRAVSRSNDAERRLQRDGIEVVVEARARPVPLRLVGHARDVPAAELGQRLAAEARAADAEEDDGVGALRQLGERGLGGGDVRRLLGDAQQRQAAARDSRPAGRRAPGASGSSQRASSACAQAVLADGAVEAAGDRMRVGGRAPAPARDRCVLMAARPSANCRAMSSRWGRRIRRSAHSGMTSSCRLPARRQDRQALGLADDGDDQLLALEQALGRRA